MLRSRHPNVQSSGKKRNAPREWKSVETRQLSRCVWGSPSRVRMTILVCVLLAMCLESKTRVETAAPWCPDARCKQLWQRLRWVRLCADYRLPPPPASPIISQSITTRLSQQHTARLDWQHRHTFALFLHCKNVPKSSKVISGSFFKKVKILFVSAFKPQC